ncbi:serine hydrolase [uncultured Maricaulis sp.]|uniref:serine hydrolase domain-containing protein n=1 Tax=uncultured Maricaulis sp. TaxID=174710 RepID=UPI0026130864|nr:serine hydrolase domain-containing protein [uncultured Maricaulis sp.]
MPFGTQLKWLTAALAALSCASAFAQDTPIDPADPAVIDGAVATPETEPVTAPTEAGSPSLTRSDVDAWLDGFMPYALSEGDIVGAQVTVVRDGEILTSRGYGYADLAERRPVDGYETMFRPGSISKLFTWISVMQMVEQGRLDLDEDVNTYLDFEIPATFGEPVTMRHLMTHTPGFQERFRNLIIGDPELALPLEDFLKQAAPPSQIFPPGETPAYSNYGTAVAGYIVQRLAGQPFEDYVAAQIFEPMGMDLATFHQPLPERFEPYMSSGYINAADGEAQYYELVPMAPAGSMAASGEAMGRFMIGLLERNPDVLAPATWEQMYETTYQLTPPLNAMALGFWELDKGGLRIRGHGGDTGFFHSDLNVMLDENVGIYVVVNSSGAGAGPLRFAVTASFAERYFPETVEPVGPRLETAMEHGAMVVGEYESSRTVVTNFAAILRFLGQESISMNADGDLVYMMFGKPTVWREVEPFVWRHVDGYEQLAATFDEDGTLAYVTFEPVSPIIHLMPAPWYRAGSLVTPLLFLSLGLLLVTLILWPVRAIVRWRYGKAFPLSGREAMSYRLVRVGIALVFVFLTAWFMLFQTLFSDLAGLGSGFGTQLFLTMAMQLLLYIAVAAAVWNTLTVWRSRQSWFAKLWSVIIPLMILFVILFAGLNGLLSWETNF